MMEKKSITLYGEANVYAVKSENIKAGFVSQVTREGDNISQFFFLRKQSKYLKRITPKNLRVRI